ncbi:hypothetical protein MSAN_00831800 [Mycena sanguinolenta]|uniref:CxC2-like cysteine cluster KDZ transposase-associated domain-containing protein n=1 Tax=Mycena sanguinolenta TaxID=230812 RepID=A0A8H6YZK9_9AGAR|nr:hypothetical protein MSAN_00831800 [Mycena sanguinolenta]
MPGPVRKKAKTVAQARKLPANSSAKKHQSESESDSDAESSKQRAKRKMAKSHVDLNVNQPLPELPPPPPPKPEKLRKQSRWEKSLPLLQGIQDAVLEAGHYHPGIGKLCECGLHQARFRCSDKCFKSPMLCATCIVKMHHNHLFHHIDEWPKENGRHFVRTSLKDLGLRIQTDLKSGAMPCPNDMTPNEDGSIRSRDFVVVEENGFHDATIEFCACPGEDNKLIAVRLFPATWKQPKTVFTFTVLQQFHIHSLTSKKSAYDYVRALAKLTDSTFPQDVANRYREFQHTYRIWRYLALQRRTGQAHGIDAHLPHRRAGSLAIRCPACPEVGFNITEEILAAADESEKHKYRLFLSIDGNFKLQRKNKRDDPDDVALNDGNAYFVKTKEFKEYLAKVKPGDVEDLGSCAHFRAARMQNISKFKNAVISGVVAVQCARHGFYLPCGMVDLKKGEAFANTDYALCSSLSEAWKQRFIMVTYDIWCQYHVKLLGRVGTHFGSLLETLKKIEGAIGKMHVHNHVDACDLLYNLNWLPNSACTVGELIETGWAEQNLTAGSTKEQNDGHRHDSIDDTSGHWNWEKLIKITDALVRLYRINAADLVDREREFQNSNATNKPELVAGWEKMKVTPEVFRANLKNGPPTHAATYEKLMDRELSAAKDGVANYTGDTALIATALLMERDQYAVSRLIKRKAHEEDMIRVARARLIKGLTELRARQAQRSPELASLMNDIDVEKPEKENLFLPSEYTASMRDQFKLASLALVEYSLREANAHDALEKVRVAIRIYNVNVAFKKANVHGQGANTKGRDYLRTLWNDVQIAASDYRVHQAALLKLGLPVDDQALQPLLREQLHGKSGKPQAVGQSKEIEPWFWGVGRPSNLSESEELAWNTELDRVKWFRDRALLQRAQEERETLEEEFSRTRVAFHSSARIWSALAEDASRPGRKAYAEKQSSMYSALAERCFVARGKLPVLVAADLEKKRKKEEAAAEKARLSNKSVEQEDEQLFDTLK